MIRSFRSEWLKLRRPVMVVGGGGSIIGFTILVTVLTFANAATTPKPGPGQGLTLGQLATTDGLARTIARSATFTGAVALTVFAIAIAGEYAQGTLRNLLAATLGWGLLGALLALLLRSPAAAVGAGLAYALPFELLVGSAWDDSARWLPGQLLQTLAEGGAATVTYTRAALLQGSYGALAVAVATTLFARRDVATGRPLVVGRHHPVP